MSPMWFANYPYGPFLDDISLIDEGFVDDSDTWAASPHPCLENIFIPAPPADAGFADESDTSSLPDLEDIFTPATHDDGEGLAHGPDDGGHIINIVITVCILSVIGIGMASAIMKQSPTT